ncbi:AAA family ATPase [candidate division WWE3 bacterium]|nr:AAA family ATPase [candidate division WWE3 bacterium]
MTKYTTDTLKPDKIASKHPISDRDIPTTNPDGGFLFEEIAELQAKVDASKDLPDDLKVRLEKMVRRLNTMAKMGTYSADFDIVSKYINTVISIPWTTRTEDKLDLKGTLEMLNATHYGMPSVKDRVMEYLSTMILMKRHGENAIAKSPVLLLVGLQGVGKTTVAISLAKALNRKFVRVSMGAIGSTTELRGQSKSMPEAEPGQIIKALIKTGVRNPVILLDEIEKASGQAGLLSEVMAILLELLDPAQNISFRDHYVDYPYDLSEVLLICSANNTGTLSAALMDRLEILKMPSYSNAEKVVIARDYVFPKVLENSGLEKDELQVDPNLWPDIIRPFGFDSGIRSITRTLESVARKAAREIVEGSVESILINKDNLKYYLPK